MQASKKYANFGQRFIAMIIDNIVFSLILSPFFMLFFEHRTYTDEELKQILSTQGPIGLVDPKEMLIQQLVVLAITVFFWVRFAGTPGKRILKMRIVDATTGNKLTLLQSITRYFGYFISALPMGFGFWWILIDKRNQGWHDKFANSVVIYDGEIGESLMDDPQTDKPLNYSDKDDDTFAA